jgi:hypothetical protein
MGPIRLGRRFCHKAFAVPYSRRIEASLTIAKAFEEIRGVEASLQGRIKVDGTFA